MSEMTDLNLDYEQMLEDYTALGMAEARMVSPELEDKYLWLRRKLLERGEIGDKSFERMYQKKEQGD